MSEVVTNESKHVVDIEVVDLDGTEYIVGTVLADAKQLVDLIETVGGDAEK